MKKGQIINPCPRQRVTLTLYTDELASLACLADEWEMTKSEAVKKLIRFAVRHRHLFDGSGQEEIRRKEPAPVPAEPEAEAIDWIRAGADIEALRRGLK